MKKLITKEQEAFEMEGLDINNIKVEGFPERHREAIIAAGILMMVHDANNPEFQPDYTNHSQYKYQNYFRNFTPSGVGFSFNFADYWYSLSYVGARLVSENKETSEHNAKHFEHLYKKLFVYDRKKEYKPINKLPEMVELTLQDISEGKGIGIAPELIKII